MHEPWEVFRIGIDDIEEAGDVVSAAIRFQATGEDSGVEVDMRFGIAVRIRDGVATELHNRRTVEEAREALPQDQPSGIQPSARRSLSISRWCRSTPG